MVAVVMAAAAVIAAVVVIGAAVVPIKSKKVAGVLPNNQAEFPVG